MLFTRTLFLLSAHLFHLLFSGDVFACTRFNVSLFPSIHIQFYSLTFLSFYSLSSNTQMQHKLPSFAFLELLWRNFPPFAINILTFSFLFSFSYILLLCVFPYPYFFLFPFPFLCIDFHTIFRPWHLSHSFCFSGISQSCFFLSSFLSFFTKSPRFPF